MNPLYDQLMRGRNPMQNMNPAQGFQNGSISPMAHKKVISFYSKHYAEVMYMHDAYKK